MIPDLSLTAAGDPLEMAALEATGYQFEAVMSDGLRRTQSLLLPSLVSPDRQFRVQLRHRFPFNSTLKRYVGILLKTI